MSDRFFYPFVVLLIGAIIAAALFAGGPIRTPAKTPAQIVETGYEVQGEALRNLINSPGTTVNFALDNDGKVSNAVMAAHLGKAEAPPSAGVFVTLGPAYETAFGGKELEITVRAKAGAENPSETFTAQYFTSGTGDSRPEPMNLTGQYQDYSFTFTPKPSAGEPSADYIGIWPSLDGQKRTMDVESIRVKVLN